jgi:transcriptional regulator with XRE-family HTH domain
VERTPSAAAAIAAAAEAMDKVGPRLKQVRAQRRMTLIGVAETTGISKSTLSRLENGQRRPTLELLFALSQAYRVPLDTLVDAPEVGDPRIRLKPGRVKGRTVIPLTRQPDGMQAWKIVIPIRKVTPEPRAHDGHEWIYVLSGRVRLVPRRPGLGPRAWRSRRVRHPGAALVRQHGRSSGRDLEHLQPPRRADDSPNNASAELALRGVLPCWSLATGSRPRC